MSILSAPTFCIVTGGNQGLGREIALQLTEKFGPGSTLCLIDRDPMDETAKTIKQKVGENVEVRCIKADLSDEQSIADSNQSIFEGVEASKFTNATLVHNVMLGDMSRYSKDLDDLELIQKCNMVNIAGPIVLTSEFLKVFGTPGTDVRKTIVNITSASARSAVKTTHLYSAGKAAREIFFRVLSVEEPDLRIVSFSPGAMDTEGFRHTLSSVHEEMRAQAERIRNWEGFLKPEQSAGALIKTLEEDKYENAEVVQCYDVLGIKMPGA